MLMYNFSFFVNQIARRPVLRIIMSGCCNALIGAFVFILFYFKYFDPKNIIYIQRNKKLRDDLTGKSAEIKKLICILLTLCFNV